MLNITADYKFYILMCGIFNPQRSPIKHWAAYEQVFTKLMAEQKEFGQKRFFQSVILLFKRNPEMKPQAATFCKILYDTSYLSDSFFTKWHDQKAKLDKTCCLYDRKAEKEMRAQLTGFIDWLSNAEYDAEEEDDVEEKEEVKKEEKPEEPESEAARQ